MSQAHLRFFVTCAKGTEGALRRELVALRIPGPRGDTGGVSFEGYFDQGMQVCLWSRVGMRVLIELAHFRAADADELYTGARTVDWPLFLSAKTTLAVAATVQDNPEIRHSGFAALKIKDAVVDAVRDRLGARPDVNPRDPDVSIFLHLRGAEARLYLDMAGEPLHRRGYRVAMTAAPLKETLAAAVLALGGASPELPFIDPMTGSGTLAIEHALVARQMAPGLRRRFGFERWPDQRHAPAWEQLKEQARSAIEPASPAPILARDTDPAAVQAAERNADEAGVRSDITFEVGDVSDLAKSAARTPPGTICLNPPYGERLDQDNPAELYRHTARALAPLDTWRIVVLAGNPLFLKAMGRKPAISHRLWNGPIEARLLVYTPS